MLTSLVINLNSKYCQFFGLIFTYLLFWLQSHPNTAAGCLYLWRTLPSMVRIILKPITMWHYQKKYILGRLSKIDFFSVQISQRAKRYTQRIGETATNNISPSITTFNWMLIVQHLAWLQYLCFFRGALKMFTAVHLSWKDHHIPESKL